MDYTVAVDGLGDRTLKQIQEDVYKMLPVWTHSSPVTKLVSNLVIALRIKQAEVAELTSTAAVTQTKKDEQEHIEPSSREKPSNTDKGELVHGVREFKVDADLGI